MRNRESGPGLVTWALLALPRVATRLAHFASVLGSAALLRHVGLAQHDDA